MSFTGSNPVLTTRGDGIPDGFRCVTYPHTTNNIR